MDSDRLHHQNFLAQQSQASQRYNPRGHDDDYGAPPSPRSSDSAPLQSVATFDPALLVDHLANNYNLEDIYRDDLHSFLSIARPLPEVQLKIALVQQATALQTQQLLSEVKQICGSFRATTMDIQNSISQNIVFTKDQQAEVTAACKLQIFDGRRIEFDNEAIKADVMPYLKKHKESNGLNSFFEETTNTARYRAISKLVGRQASYAKTFVRRTILQSISDKNRSSLTTLTALLARKCLGASENASPKHTIWCAIILPTKDDGDDEDEQETSTVPVKRSRNGNRKKVTGDSELLEDFWVEVGALFKEKNKSWGSDLKAPGWALFVNVSIAEERRLHPEDSLPLIPTTNSAPPPQAPPSSRPGNLTQVMADHRNTPRTPLALSSENYARHGHSSSLSGAYSRSASSADASALYPYGLYSSDSQVPRAPSPSRSLQGLGSRLPPMIATFGTMDGHNGDRRSAHNQYSPGSELPPIRSFDAGGSYSNSG
ncbi:hypothetical protein B0H10DRAFT_2339405 [Mycena sp. CBHHK59/15]|nr:hypothetical protein B0H10DRAFT_2339405 [Mycena sp. CBHHK59/15]